MGGATAEAFGRGDTMKTEMTQVRDGYSLRWLDGGLDWSGERSRKVHAPDGGGIGEVVGRPGAWRALYFGTGHLLTTKTCPDAIETIIYKHERADREMLRARVAAASAGGAFRSPQLVEDGPPIHVSDLAAIAASRGAPLTLDEHPYASIRNRAQREQGAAVACRLRATCNADDGSGESTAAPEPCPAHGRSTHHDGHFRM